MTEHRNADHLSREEHVDLTTGDGAKRSLMIGWDGENHEVIKTDFNGNLIVASGGASVDAFGRNRVSNPVTLFDSKQIFDNAPLLWDDQEVSGTGTTSTHSVAEAATTIAVSATTAGKRVRQTFMRFNYQPGKSQLIMMTGVLGTGASGITQELGYFDENNGLFFKCDDAMVYVVRRTSVTGTPVDTSVAMTDWNTDTMDGNGPSGIALDFNKTQIYIVDFEWLGVGRVRMGFVHNGSIIYCHEFMNSNVLDKVYMSKPNLPLRYSIENDGTAGADSLVHICGTVISEGGSQELGIVRYASTNGTHIDANTENLIYAIIGVRLKSTHLAAAIKLQRLAIQIQTGSENGEWILLFNPTVAGTFTYVDETNSAVQVARGATANTVTNGTSMDGGFAQSLTGGAGSGGATETVENAVLLGSAIDGTRDEFVLCWRPTGGTNGHDIEGSMHWREFS